MSRKSAPRASAAPACLALLLTVLLTFSLPPQLTRSAQAQSATLVPHVRSERPSGATYRLDPVPLWSIALRGDTTAPQLEIVGALRLSDGRVAIAEGASSTVRFYSPSLRLDTTISLRVSGRGRPNLLGLERVGRDSMAVLAMGAGWLIGPDGSARLIATPPGSLRPTDILMSMGVLRDGSSVWGVYDLANQRRPPSNRWTDSIDVVRHTPSGEVQSIARLPLMQLADRGPDSAPELWFAPFLVFKAKGDEFYHGYGTDYILTRRNVVTGRQETWARAWTKRAVTRADISEFIDGWSLNWNRGPDSTAVKGRMRNHPYADSVPAFSELLVSAEGELWVRSANLADAQGNGDLRRVPHRPSVWSVFDGGGTWTADVTFPTGFHPTDIGRDYVLGVQYGMKEGWPRGRERGVSLYRYEKRLR